MRGPAELVDHGDGAHLEPLVHKGLRVAGKARGAAGDHRDHGDVRRGQCRHLRLRARAGRVDHRGVESRQLIGQQRPAEQVARLGRDPLEPRRAAPAPVDLRQDFRQCQRADGFDIERVDFETLLAQSDVIVLLCLLTDETRHLINEGALHRMKNTAYLINVARGAIIDQAALARALVSGEIAGCGLDAYDPEPIAADDPLLKLHNANLTPHALGYTDEMIRLCSELCVEAALKVRRGEEPASVINREVLDSAKLKARMESYQRTGD